MKPEPDLPPKSKEPNIPRLLALASTLISLPVIALLIFLYFKGCPS